MSLLGEALGTRVCFAILCAPAGLNGDFIALVPRSLNKQSFPNLHWTCGRMKKYIY